MSGTKVVGVADGVKLEITEKPDGSVEAWLYCDCGSSRIGVDTAEQMARMLERFIEAQPEDGRWA